MLLQIGEELKGDFTAASEQIEAPQVDAADITGVTASARQLSERMNVSALTGEVLTFLENSAFGP